MQNTKIDYTELNDRIVMQAIEKANFHMDEKTLEKLLKGKIARAQAMMELRNKEYITIKD